MQATEFFSAQLDREILISRRVLERVPEGRANWKPHEKSMALGYLATLVATIPGWIALAIDQDELDLAPPGGSSVKPAEWRTTGELIAQLEDSATRARRALAGTTEDHLTTTWKLLVAGRVVNESTLQVVIADALCHASHHRGQLAVYLRLLGAAVPSIYGPSADDRTF